MSLSKDNKKRIGNKFQNELSLIRTIRIGIDYKWETG